MEKESEEEAFDFSFDQDILKVKRKCGMFEAGSLVRSACEVYMLKCTRFSICALIQTPISFSLDYIILMQTSTINRDRLSDGSIESYKSLKT